MAVVGAVALKAAWWVTSALVAEILRQEFLSEGETDQEVPTLTIRRLQVVHQLAASVGAGEDVRITTHDYINLTGGAPDSTWTDADYLVVENAMDNFWTALSSLRAHCNVVQYRWYQIVPGETRTGVPRRVVTKSMGTSGGSVLPAQVAVTVTERTGLRNHWGRFYIPAPSTTILTAHGRISAASCATIAGAAETMYDSIVANSATIVPVVYSRRLRGALRVREVQVDDIPDVQRSRRLEVPQIRERRIITAAQVP